MRGLVRSVEDGAHHAFTFSVARTADVVVPQEQILQRGRLADQAAHARVAEDLDHLAEAVAVDLRAQRVARRR